MKYKKSCFTLILLAGVIAGCESKSGQSKANSSKAAPKSAEIAPNGLPADWNYSSGISVSKSESPEGLLDVTLTGKNQSFNTILDQIRGKVPKPINFRAEVDPEQVLSEFEIKMDDGSWEDLLTLVAGKFNCLVEENSSEFLVVPKK